MKKIFFILLLHDVCHIITAQPTVGYSPYIGTWRWVSGKKDTLVILLKPAPPSNDPYKTSNLKVIGYHRYVQSGIEQENSLGYVSEKKFTANTTLLGNMMDDQIGLKLILLYKDHIEKMLKGHLTIIPYLKGKTFAVLDIPYYEQQEFDFGYPWPPHSRTIPNNIILEKNKVGSIV